MVHSTLPGQRLFTLDEANRTLPLVSRILTDIVRTYGEIEAKQTEVLQSQADGAIEPDGESAAADTVPGPVRDKIAELQTYLKELSNIGCECKDFAAGLVDFPARLEERVVLLCWKLGEPHIDHWHELDAGFAGRQPVADLFRTASVSDPNSGSDRSD